MYRSFVLPILILLAGLSAESPARVPAGNAPTPPFPGTEPAQRRIQELVADVSGSVIDSYVLRLESFVTRWALHDSCDAAAAWIHDQFESSGMDTVFMHEFSGLYSGNVVGVKYGKSDPDSIVIVGGHYDSVSNNAYFAPGADDNASGTACVLECARVLGGADFERTLMFIAFGAEEQGRDGSQSMAADAAARSEGIVAMINADMIGYLADGDDLDLDIVANDGSRWLLERAFDAAATHVPDLAVVEGEYTGFSDHMSYWEYGYDAIVLFEDSDQTSPYMHTTRDSVGISYNCPELAEKTTRVAVALLADLAGPILSPTPVPPPGLAVLDQNYPNPFNPVTTIRFRTASPGLRVSLTVFDAAGRFVDILLGDVFVDGEKEITWDGTNAAGEPVSSGVYFYRLTAAGSRLTRKMLLVR